MRLDLTSLLNKENKIITPWDLFAAAAITGAMVNGVPRDCAVMAAEAADALIAERLKRLEGKEPESSPDEAKKDSRVLKVNGKIAKKGKIAVLRNGERRKIKKIRFDTRSDDYQFLVIFSDEKIIGEWYTRDGFYHCHTETTIDIVDIEDSEDGL